MIDTLKDAFVDGRLTKDELDVRAGRALASRTYAATLRYSSSSGPASSISGPGW
jgi:hypothetical protein